MGSITEHKRQAFLEQLRFKPYTATKPQPIPGDLFMARLVRSSHDKMLLGVCGGLAQRFGIDSTLIRIIFVIASVLGMGSPILLYFILAFIIPKD
jgi:phage shock protein C